MNRLKLLTLVKVFGIFERAANMLQHFNRNVTKKTCELGRTGDLFDQLTPPSMLSQAVKEVAGSKDEDEPADEENEISSCHVCRQQATDCENVAFQSPDPVANSGKEMQFLFLYFLFFEGFVGN